MKLGNFEVIPYFYIPRYTLEPRFYWFPWIFYRRVRKQHAYFIGDKILVDPDVYNQLANELKKQ